MTSTPAIEGYSEEKIVYHVYIMKQGNLLDAEPMITAASTIPEFFYEIRLTWTGHEFLDAARDETIWKKAKSMAQEKVQSTTFGVLIQVLSSLAKNQLGL